MLPTAGNNSPDPRFAPVPRRILVAALMAAWALVTLHPTEAATENSASIASADSTLRAMVPDGFAGSVLVARGGDVLLHRHYGLDLPTLERALEAFIEVGKKHGVLGLGKKEIIAKFGA